MNPPKMPVHIGDYKRDTGHLRAAGHGAYLLLLFHHWTTGGLPEDDDQLAAIACMTRGEWKKARPIIEKFFKPGWRHGRVEKDLAAAHTSYEKRAKAGEKGGKAKAETKQCSSNATALPQQPLTLDQDRKKDYAPDGASTNGKAYAFESGIIRLTAKDFSKWEKAFTYLDLAAELTGLTKWAGEQGQNWFHAVAGALAKRNREEKMRREKPAIVRGNPQFEGIT